MKFLAVLALSFSLFLPAFAEEVGSAASSQVIVPRLVRFSGQVKDATGTVGITFTLHKSQNDSTALWIETQNVQLDAAGKYTVLLGATKSEGLPVELFTSGEAQWLGIHVQGQPDQPRVLLVSVPYALKAAEAETLGGHSATDFVTSDKVTSIVQQQLQNPQPGTAIHGTPLATSAGATDFKAGTPDQVVSVTQTSTGMALTATAASTALDSTSTATTGTTYGVEGNSSSPTGAGVYGVSHATSGASFGVEGLSTSPTGYGVFGISSEATGLNFGIYGQTQSTSGTALKGNATATSGNTKGVIASVSSPNGIAAIFQANNASGKILSGQSGSSHTEVFSVDGAGDVTASGEISATSAGIGVSGTSNAANYGVYGSSSAASGVFGVGPVDGVVGNSHSGNGVLGYTTSGSGYGIMGENTAGTGVYGMSTSSGGTGVYGYSGATPSSNGVIGSGATGVAGFATVNGSVGTYGDAGTSSGSQGMRGRGEIGVVGNSSVASSTGYGVYGSGPTGVYAVSNVSAGNAFNGTSDSGVVYEGSVTGSGGYAIDTFAASGGYAAWFNGDGASFQRLDHPLDPTNKYLVHASVESSEMKNIYDGTITTNTSGEAVVNLPDWFEALNGDFRYQLTTIGQPAQAWIGTRIANGRFTIRTDKPNVEVSWQVTGVRKDAYAKAHPLQVEMTKPAIEQGSYLHPEAFGQPEERSVGWALRPEAMKHWKESRAAGETRPNPVPRATPAK